MRIVDLCLTGVLLWGAGCAGTDREYFNGRGCARGKEVVLLC